MNIRQNISHTITIDDGTYQKLKRKGNFGETYSKLILRIIKDSDKYHGSYSPPVSEDKYQKTLDDWGFAEN